MMLFYARREAARPLHARQAPFGGRDRRILQFIHDYMEAQGYAPTIREMASYMDSAPSTIFRHLRLLEQAGYLDHCKGKIRAIVLTDLGRQALLPPVGGAGGGQP